MIDHDDGSQPLPPSKLRSPLLRKHGNALAQDCFDRIYATWPELDERYGERGRYYTAEDNYWHLEHLDEALASAEPALFDAYADWLLGLLRARGLGPEHVAGAFGFLADGIANLDCTPRLERHRRMLIAVLRSNQDRILGASTGGRTNTR